MGVEKLDAVACQYRFWRMLGNLSPKVREDLFDRGRKTAWNLKDWDARWARLVLWETGLTLDSHQLSSIPRGARMSKVVKAP
jgi:hypothetical protein